MAYGLIFYWIGWLLWIIITFFMVKGLQRTMLACLILVSILCSDFYVTIGGHHILLSFIIIIIVATLIHARLPKQLYHVFISFTIMIGYTALLLWKRGSPLWLFTPEFILLPIMSSVLILILIKGLDNQIITGVLGMSLGEALHGFILGSYELQNSIGNLDFFDALYFTMAILMLLKTLQAGCDRLGALLNSYKQLQKRPKRIR